MKFNKKMIIMLCSVVGIIVLIIILMMLFLSGRDKQLEYSEIEERIIFAGKNYYEDNKDKLPEFGTTSISASTLVAEGYLNNLSNYTKEGITCNGTLYVTKNPTDYSYRAKLDCGSDYSSKYFSSIVTKEVVSNGSGLYQMEQIEPNSGTVQTVYVFRGDNVNNYVKVGDFYWEIVKVYENGEIAMLGDPELLRTKWDDRFNIETENYRGINEYEVSRMKDAILSEVVNDQDGYLIIKSLITPHTACIGKRSLNDTSKDGSTECSEILTNQYFSLLPAYDYMNASLDNNCNTVEDYSCYNYNYLTSGNEEFWTITGVKDNTQDVYYVDNVMEHEYANVTKTARLYVHLDANVTYVSGTGSYEDPYIVK